MTSASNEMAHPKFRIRLRPDGIVSLVFAPGVSVGSEDAVAATDAIVELFGRPQCPLLVDVQDAHAQDRSARLEFARRTDLALAIALIVASPLSRIMGNLFVNFSHPIAPTRMFDDEASAVAWLKQFTS